MTHKPRTMKEIDELLAPKPDIQRALEYLADIRHIEEMSKDVRRSPDCCGCASFPYALCGPCYRYNHD